MITKREGKRPYGAYKGMYSPFFGLRSTIKGDIPQVPYDDYNAMQEIADSLTVSYDIADEDHPIRVFIGSELSPSTGRYIALPADEDELGDLTHVMSFNGSGDWTVADVETYYPEMSSLVRGKGLDELEELAETLVDLDEQGAIAVGLILDANITSDIEEAVNIATGYSGSVTYYDSAMDAAYGEAENMSDDALFYRVDEEQFKKEASGDFYEGSDLYEEWGGDEDAYLESELEYLETSGDRQTMMNYLDWKYTFDELRHDYAVLEDSDGGIYLVSY